MKFNFWKFFFIWLVVLSTIIFIILSLGLGVSDLGTVIFVTLFLSIPISFVAIFIFKWIAERRFSRVGGVDTSPVSINEVGKGFSLSKPSVFIPLGVLIMVINIAGPFSIGGLMHAVARVDFIGFLIFLLIYSAFFLIYIAIMLIRIIQGCVPRKLALLVIAGCLLSVFRFFSYISF